MHGTCQKDSLSLLLGRPLYSSRNSRAFLTCDFTGSGGGEAAHKLSGRRALLHQRKRLRARCCQARTVLLRRGFVLLSFRWLASAEKALKPSRAATTAWAWVDFARFLQSRVGRCRSRGRRARRDTAHCYRANTPRRSLYLRHSSRSPTLGECPTSSGPHRHNQAGERPERQTPGGGLAHLRVLVARSSGARCTTADRFYLVTPHSQEFGATSKRSAKRSSAPWP